MVMVTQDTRLDHQRASGDKYSSLWEEEPHCSVQRNRDDEREGGNVSTPCSHPFSKIQSLEPMETWPAFPSS